jgi:hypothetical protein
MVLPISLRPAHPGDGSGLCDPRPSDCDRRGERYGEAYDQTVQRKLAAARERAAYRAFRAMFTDQEANDE